MSGPPAQIAVYLDYIKEHVQKIEALRKFASFVESKTKVNFEYFVVGFLVLLVVMLFSGIGADIICHLAAFLYPFYMTLSAIESRNAHESTFWLVYWVTYGFIGLLENFLTFFLYWIPFFYPLKLTFILWTFLPQFRGADTIYKSFLLPHFKKHESSIDSALNSMGDSTKVLSSAKNLVGLAASAVSAATTAASSTATSTTTPASSSYTPTPTSTD